MNIISSLQSKMTKQDIELISDTINEIIAGTDIDSDEYWPTVTAFIDLKYKLLKKGIDLDVINYKFK